MNSVIITGRLTKDVDLRSNGESEVARFTVAVDRRVKVDGEWKKDSDFIPCVAFDKKASFVEKYFQKGSSILVEGNIHTGSYTNKEGVKIYTTDVVVEDVEFFGKSEEPKQKPEQKPKHQPMDGFMNVDAVDDVGLPFN